MWYGKCGILYGKCGILCGRCGILYGKYGILYGKCGILYGKCGSVVFCMVGVVYRGVGMASILLCRWVNNFGDEFLEPSTCSVCGQEATKRCSRCRTEWYCSR